MSQLSLGAGEGTSVLVTLNDQIDFGCFILGVAHLIYNHLWQYGHHQPKPKSNRW